MNCYEHTIIAKQDLQESQVKKIIEKWGLKKFSYLIKNNKKGFYFHIKFEGTGKTINELEKAENIDQTLIRFLTIKVKKHDLDKVYFEKKES